MIVSSRFLGHYSSLSPSAIRSPQLAQMLVCWKRQTAPVVRQHFGLEPAQASRQNGVTPLIFPDPIKQKVGRSGRRSASVAVFKTYPCRIDESSGATARVG